MHAIRSYYEYFAWFLSVNRGIHKIEHIICTQFDFRIYTCFSNLIVLIGTGLIVITSYSIHYTKLYDYVLVEAALVGEVSHHLRNTPNVIGFLGGSEKPVPLRQSEVNRILGTVDELQDSNEELNIPYVVGETVKVTFGPFSGFSGIIEEVNSEKKKLKVMVKIFGRKTPLELGFMQVEKE